MSRKPIARLTVNEARATLKQLYIETTIANPGEVAPVRWVSEMHQALRSIAAREDVQRLRLDGLHQISASYLHRRVAQILDEFDHLVANNPRLHDVSPR